MSRLTADEYFKDPSGWQKKFQETEARAKANFQLCIRFCDTYIRRLTRSDHFTENAEYDRDKLLGEIYNDKFLHSYTVVIHGADISFKDVEGIDDDKATLRRKRDQLQLLVKQLLGDNDAFKKWETEVKRHLRKHQRNTFEGGEHTAFTTPYGKYLVVGHNGDVVACIANAITALRDYLSDNKATIKWDVWRNNIVIDDENKKRLPRESKDFIIKELVNEIYESKKLLFSIEQLKTAMGQLAVMHKCHSAMDYFDALQWDEKDRIKLLVVDIMKLEGTEYQLSVITKQLIASVRRVKLPGAKYDMCPLLIAPEGWNKSTFLQVLYGRRNVLAEDILDLSTKEQSEKMRNGIMCVEFADTLGDDKRTQARKIKAFITRQDDVGRDAYGRVEDVEHIGRTAVFWHTGNNPHLLTSEEGNRRFSPMHLRGPMDVDLLRRERDQIWAQIVALESVGRNEFEAKLRVNGTPVSDDIVYPDVMLEEKYYATAAQLQNQAMVKTRYEELLGSVILWFDVIWSADDRFKWYSISIFSDTIKEHLQIPDYRWNGEAQKISRFMKKKVELRKEECEGLEGDVCWVKVDNLKKGGDYKNVPLNGYRVELRGDVGERAYHILMKRKEDFDKEIGLLPNI